MNEITLLGIVCLAQSLWLLRLQHRLSRAKEFAEMTAMCFRDVADGIATITRSGDGTITIEKVK